MILKETTLGAVSSNIQTGPFGSQLHQSDYSEIGIPVVMPKDLLNGKICEDSIARVTEDHIKRLSKHKIEIGDILYSRRGDVGRCAYATENEAGWLCGTGCLRVTIDTQKADSKYIFYRLQMPETIGWVVNHAVGSTMLNLNTSILGEVPLKLPSLEEQKSVVSVLSAYDNLIENNQKQIKLLEEAAQRLYKEWFVDLRFPGYENTPVVDGVPQGWEKTTLSKVAQLCAGGDKPKAFSKAKDKLHVVPVYANGIEKEGLYGYTDKATITDDSITISARGNVGYTCLRRTPFLPIVRLITVVPPNECVEYLYFYLKDKTFKSNGAAQQQITVPMIKDEEIILPIYDLLFVFKEKVSLIFDMIDHLKTQKELCEEARDRLLPKLMSGELEV